MENIITPITKRKRTESFDDHRNRKSTDSNKRRYAIEKNKTEEKKQKVHNRFQGFPIRAVSSRVSRKARHDSKKSGRSRGSRRNPSSPPPPL